MAASTPATSGNSKTGKGIKGPNRRNGSAIIDSNARITKSKEKTGAIKRRNGLLNTKIPATSKYMQLAKRNSVDSPLLNLPPEIRNKIWGYALGGHRIELDWGDDHDIKIVNCSMIGATTKMTYIDRPKFQIHRVCRQIYAETALLPYIMNTFAFDHDGAFSPWIKSLLPAQKKAVKSLEPPADYLCYYRLRSRRKIRAHFPNLKHIDLAADLRSSYRDMKGLLEAREGLDLEVHY